MWKHKNLFVSYLLITLVVAMVYATAQQTYRQSANDPQVQIAWDLANQLGKSTALNSNDLPRNIDLSSSIAPFVIIADEKGKTLVSTAAIGGATPTVPSGVYAHALKNGENRLTWQPQVGVREAIVVVHYVNPNDHTDQYVVAGRSLQEVEKRVEMLGKNLLVGWLVLMSITTLFFVEKPKLAPRKRK